MDDTAKFVKVPQQLTFRHGNLVFCSNLHRLSVTAHKPTMRTKIPPDIVRNVRKGVQENTCTPILEAPT